MRLGRLCGGAGAALHGVALAFDCSHNAAPLFPVIQRAMKTVFLSMMLLACAPAAAEVCRWTDADGRVHYSNSPPAGVTCSRTLRVPPPTTGSEGPARDYKSQELEFQQRRVQRAEAEKRAEQEKMEADRRREACGQARGRLAWLEGGGRVVKIDETGQRQFLDDRQMASEVAGVR